MTHVAFFGHNAYDAAVRRRAVGFTQAGLAITGFMMRREGDAALPWTNIDLGRTFDGKFVQRIKSVFSGAKIAAAHKAELARADVIYARNLDMLLCAFLARRKAGLKTPVVYEALDIHHLLTREDLIGAAMRRAEGYLLRQCALVVISSPGFDREYFQVRHPGAAPMALVENRLTEGDDFGPDPEGAKPSKGPLRIGWFGNLRCPRSIGVMEAIKDRHGDAVEIVMRGYFTDATGPEAEKRLIGPGKVNFGGRYKAPQDLGELYDGVDVVWAGDYYEDGYNSRWLLPNRIYEGGYFAVPPIAAADTETGRWIEDHGVGFTVAEPVEQTVPDLLATLIADRAPIAAKRKASLTQPDIVFVQPANFLADVIARALKGQARGRP